MSETDPADQTSRYQLTPDQLNAFTEAFTLFSKSALLPISDLGRALRAIGQNPTDLTIQRISVAADTNGAHLIDLDAWLRLCEREFGDFMKEEQLLESFRAFDKDACGSLSVPQLRSILLFFGERVTEEQADEFVDWAILKTAGAGVAGERVNYEMLVKELLARDPGIQYSTK